MKRVPVQDTANICSQKPDFDTLGGRLSRARDAADLTVPQLARRLGVKDTTIQAWESDRSQPRANRLTMLAGVLNVSPSWLLHGVGESPSDEGRTEMIDTLAADLRRLRRAHEESARLINRLEHDLSRANGQ